MPIPDLIERILTIPVERTKVWAAIAEPVGLSRWFAGKVEGDFRPGGIITFLFEGYERSDARIEVMEPNVRFAYWWNPGAYTPPGVPFEELPKTLVEFVLEDVPGGTRVTLRESGFASLPDVHRDAAWKDNNDGWDEELAELETYLTGGAG